MKPLPFPGYRRRNGLEGDSCPCQAGINIRGHCSKGDRGIIQHSDDLIRFWHRVRRPRLLLLIRWLGKVITQCSSVFDRRVYRNIKLVAFNFGYP